MKCINEFTGCVLRKKGTQLYVGSRVFVEFRQGMSHKEDFVIKNGEGFLGYPDEESCCRLYECFLSGKNVTVEILSIKKEGVYNALFMIS